MQEKQAQNLARVHKIFSLLKRRQKHLFHYFQWTQAGINYTDSNSEHYKGQKW